MSSVEESVRQSLGLAWADAAAKAREAESVGGAVEALIPMLMAMDRAIVSLAHEIDLLKERT